MNSFEKKDLDLLFVIIHDFFRSGNKDQAYGLMGIYDTAAEDLGFKSWHDEQESKQ